MAVSCPACGVDMNASDQYNCKSRGVCPYGKKRQPSFAENDLMAAYPNVFNQGPAPAMDINEEMKGFFKEATADTAKEINPSAGIGVCVTIRHQGMVVSYYFDSADQANKFIRMVKDVGQIRLEFSRFKIYDAETAMDNFVAVVQAWGMPL